MFSKKKHRSSVSPPPLGLGFFSTFLEVFSRELDPFGPRSGGFASDFFADAQNSHKGFSWIEKTAGFGLVYWFKESKDSQGEKDDDMSHDMKTTVII